MRQSDILLGNNLERKLFLQLLNVYSRLKPVYWDQSRVFGLQWELLWQLWTYVNLNSLDNLITLEINLIIACPIPTVLTFIVTNLIITWLGPSGSGSIINPCTDMQFRTMILRCSIFRWGTRLFSRSTIPLHTASWLHCLGPDQIVISWCAEMRPRYNYGDFATYSPAPFICLPACNMRYSEIHNRCHLFVITKGDLSASDEIALKLNIEPILQFQKIFVRVDQYGEYMRVSCGWYGKSKYKSRGPIRFSNDTLTF